jgi:hypothetical protein
LTIIMFTVTLLLQRTFTPCTLQQLRTHHETLTRTIKVSCLSCFLHDSEPLTGTST